MITDRHRRIVMALVRLKVWKVQAGLFRTVEIVAPKGTRWLLERMKRRQVVDTLHHAPACPANHWHKQRLVFQRCNCGAAASGGGRGE